MISKHAITYVWMQLFMNVLLLQTSMDVLNQCKNPQVPYDFPLQLSLSVIKDAIAPPKVIIYTVHSVLVAERENLVCSRGLKEHAKKYVHICALKAILKPNYPSLQNVSPSLLH